MPRLLTPSPPSSPLSPHVSGPHPSIWVLSCEGKPQPQQLTQFLCQPHSDCVIPSLRLLSWGWAQAPKTNLLSPVSAVTATVQEIIAPCTKGEIGTGLK